MQHNYWHCSEVKNLLDRFKAYLVKEGKSENTVHAYYRHVKTFFDWFNDVSEIKWEKLYRENILDYKSYLLNIKGLTGKSVNAHLAALINFNMFLISEQIQENMVSYKTDYEKVKVEYANPTTVNETEVEGFRQKILETDSKRNYCLVTLLAYSGMRISEALGIKLADINLREKKILIRKNKEEKDRVVIINDKCVNAIGEYLAERENFKHKDSQFLFISRINKTVDRTTINHIFENASDKITPHTLRHFFCSYALENGWSVQEVAAQVGHANIQTTIMYTNPAREEKESNINFF